jgi:hypothetical protein
MSVSNSKKYFCLFVTISRCGPKCKCVTDINICKADVTLYSACKFKFLGNKLGVVNSV